MANKYNSGSRLLALLTKVLPSKDNTPALLVWSSAFKISEPDQNKMVFMVSDRLALVYREIDYLEQQLIVERMDKSLYSSALNCVRTAISPAHLNVAWASVRQQIPDAAFTAFRWFPAALPEEQTEISEEDLQSVHILVGKLQDALSVSTLPTVIVRQIQSHIDAILRALATQPITGSRSLREAVRAATGEIVENAEVIREYKDVEEVGLLFSLLNRMTTIANIAEKAEKVADVTAKMLEYGNTMIKAVSANGS